MRGIWFSCWIVVLLAHAALLHWFNNTAKQPESRPATVFSVQLSQTPAEAQTAPIQKNTAAKPKAEATPEPLLQKPKPPPEPKSSSLTTQAGNPKTLQSQAAKPKAIAVPKSPSKTVSTPPNKTPIPTQALTANQASSQKPAASNSGTQPKKYVIANSQIKAASAGDTVPDNNQPSARAALCSGAKPSYPTASRVRGEAGRVLVAILVSAGGAIKDIELRKSSGFARLDRTALNAVHNWHCQPAVAAGQSQPTWIEQSFLFGLVD